MEKMSVNDARRSTTMFLVNKDIENVYSKMIKDGVDSLRNNLIGIGTREGLENFILKNNTSIQQLITLMGIKQEKFKRVISWVRLSQGFVFDNEWDCSRVQKECCSNSKFKDVVCRLLSNGCNENDFKKIIPEFILRDFCINTDLIGRLSNKNMLANLVKEKLTIQYNQQYSAYFYELIDKSIMDICIDNGSCYIKDAQIPGVSGMHNCIKKGDSYYIIESQFYLTTSSNQTNYAKKVDELYRECRKTDNVFLVCILDGAGWIGRASDYSSIHSSCNYFLNIKNIDKLEDVINQHK